LWNGFKISHLGQAICYLSSRLAGKPEKNISPNSGTAVQYARAIGSKVIGVVGRDGGYTALAADAV